MGAASISLSAVVLESLVGAHGFRLVWFVEGLIVWATVVPLALLLLPRRPVWTTASEESDEQEARRASALPPVDWTLRQAMRTGMFWVMVGGVGVVSLLGTALAFHQISVLGERGLSSTEAAANFLPQTVAGLASTLLIGYLADRIADRVLIIGALATLTGSLVAAGFVQPGLSAFVYGVTIGVAGNSFRTLEATAFPGCFGLGHIGAIRGVVHTLGVAGSAFGPLMLSLGHDWAGSYRPVLLVLTAMPLAMIAFAVVVKHPPPYPPDHDVAGDAYGDPYPAAEVDGHATPVTRRPAEAGEPSGAGDLDPVEEQ